MVGTGVVSIVEKIDDGLELLNKELNLLSSEFPIAVYIELVEKIFNILEVRLFEFILDCVIFHFLIQAVKGEVYLFVLVEFYFLHREG